MAEITTERIKELRDRTSVSIMQCKKALEETNGNIEEAVLVLRKISAEIAAKKADRLSADGCIAVANTDTKASLVVLHSETDFVAQNEAFIKAVEALAVEALENGVESTREAAKKRAEELVLTIGENIIPGEAVVISGEHVGTYLHHNRKVGALVAINGGTETLAKDLATHIAAMNPLYKSENDIPKEEREKIIAFFEKETQETDKPKDIQEKMLQGKVKGYLSEQTLLEQSFFKNPEQTVAQALSSAGATILDFVRIKLG